MTRMSPGRTAQRRRRIVGVAAGIALLAPTTLLVTGGGASAQVYYVPVTNTLTIKGRGYGHGHGMSQYGAEGAALEGLSGTQIINFYYPHTTWSTAAGKIRVLISADTTSDLQVKPRSGLAVRDLTSHAHWVLPVKSAIDCWRLKPARNGATAVQFHTAAGWHRWRTPGGQKRLSGNGEFQASGPLTLLVPGSDGVVPHKYRGALRLVQPYAGATSRDTVNVVKMDQYVKGVVPYEMPASWQPQALQAQAVAARTFGAWLRAQNPKRFYQVCDTTACQVYGGMGSEQRASNQAVRVTKGRILTYRGKPAFTQFSASSGGWTAYGDEPYLPARKDPYDGFSGNPDHTWKVRVSATSLENAYPSIGTLIDMRVTNRDGHGAWGGRALRVVLDGSRGTTALTGDDVRWLYGLKSSWFTIRPTPIIARWRSMGGRKSPLGSVKSGEYVVGSGSAQNFTHGKIFWSSKTGAHEAMGPTLAAYRRFGGPTSRLGFPVTGMMGAPGKGHKIRLQHGRIYSSHATGAHVVYGAVLGKWISLGSAAGWLGYPTTDVTKVAHGQAVTFQHGKIRWNRRTDTFKVTHS